VVERLLAMQKVVGSSPIARSNPFRFLDENETARYPSGKGEVCKTSIRRFESGPRLHLSDIFSPVDTPI
jgi:hypothetical protein